MNWSHDYDLLFLIAFALALATLEYYTDRSWLPIWANHNHYRSFAEIGCGVFGSLLGFSIASITFLFGMIGRPHFSTLRLSKSYKQFWSIFTRSIRSYGYATTGALAYLAVDKGIESAQPEIAILYFLFALGIARTARVIWALQNMITIEVGVSAQDRVKIEKSIKGIS